MLDGDKRCGRKNNAGARRGVLRGRDGGCSFSESDV